MASPSAAKRFGKWADKSHSYIALGFQEQEGRYRPHQGKEEHRLLVVRPVLCGHSNHLLGIYSSIRDNRCRTGAQMQHHSWTCDRESATGIDPFGTYHQAGERT